MATTIEMLRDRDEPGYPLNFTSVFFLGAPRMPKLPVKDLTLEEITNAVERFLGMFPDLCVQVQHMYFRDRMSVPEIRDAMINTMWYKVWTRLFRWMSMCRVVLRVQRHSSMV